MLIADQTSSIALSYAIYHGNTGSLPQTYELGSANVGWLTALSYFGLADFVFPDCDGFVAVDAIGNTIKQWDQAIDSGGGKLYRKSVRYLGSPS